MVNKINKGLEQEFCDFKKPYNKDQTVVEANRCLFCSDAPCMQACPTNIDVPQFIHKIATNNIKGSAKTIFESNILGLSCARVCPVEVLCVGDCVYNKQGIEPIQIGKLQRYATDQAIGQQWQFFEAGNDTGKSVAIVGAGPAGLACAHALRVLGHSVTLFEKRDVLGGLNTTAIAPYKMKSTISLQEVEWLLAIGGIAIKTGIELGVDISVQQLSSEFDAVFIAIGLGEDKPLSIPGCELKNIIGALDWIEQMKLGDVSVDKAAHVVVIGGGNTALDAVRESLALGIKKVNLLYRGSEQQMSGYQHEWNAAKISGANAYWQTQPILFLGEGMVSGLECQRLDINKKTIEQSNYVIKADLVLLAIGQNKQENLLRVEGIDCERGCVVTNNKHQTSIDGVFAAGDCCNGGKEVVNSVAVGKESALCIDEYLTGELNG